MLPLFPQLRMHISVRTGRRKPSLNIFTPFIHGRTSHLLHSHFRYYIPIKLHHVAFFDRHPSPSWRSPYVTLPEYLNGEQSRNGQRAPCSSYALLRSRVALSLILCYIILWSCAVYAERVLLFESTDLTIRCLLRREHQLCSA